MLKRWLDTIRMGTHVQGVICMIDGEGKRTYRSVQLRRNQSKVEVIRAEDVARTFEEIVPILDQKIPVALVMEGKGIIRKEAGNVKGEALIHNLMPGADVRELVISEPNGKGYVGVTRKALLEKEIELWKGAGLKVTRVITGSHSLYEGLTKLVPQATAHWLDQGGSSDQNMPEVIEVGKAFVPRKSMPAYLGALACWLPLVESSWQPEYVVSIRGEERWRNQLRWLLFRVPFFFLAVLVVNYFLFSHFLTRETKLSAEVGQFQSQIQELEMIQSQIKERKELAATLGIDQNHRLAFLADRIAASLPDEIVLSSLKVHPMEGKLKEKEVARFELNSIVIHGESRESGLVNQWLDVLSSKPWAQGVELIRFEWKEDIGQFEAEIRV